MKDGLHLLLRDRVEDVADAAEKVAAFAGRHGADDSAQFKLRLAVDELLTNVVSYGFSEAESERIHIHLTAWAASGCLRIELDDTGQPFNPLDLPAPDIDADLEKRDVGGLGIHFVKSTMHEVAYRREHGHNITLLRYDL